MKVKEFKKDLKLHLSIAKKTFTPITEFIFINGDEIRSTDLETYIVSYPDIPIPFTASVPAVDLKKFLDSLDGDIELEFEKMDNYINVKYGKKAVFKLPFSTESFPELVESFSEKVSLIVFNDNIFEHFKNALNFCSKDVSDKFNGIYITNKNIYSTNREIVYCGNYGFNINDSFVYIPYKIGKFILDNRIDELFITNDQLRAVVYGHKIHYMKKQDVQMPDFDKIFQDVSSEDSLIINEESPEIIEILNRCNNFEDVVNVNISNKILNISNNRISEEINIETITDKINFKCSVKYFIDLLSLCHNLNISRSVSGSDGGKMVGFTLNYKIVAALISLG